MKAAVLERRGVEGVSWRDFPDPRPAPGESVLRVAASSINRVDLYMRDSGVGITHSLPQVMGVEAAGEVVEAAPDSGLKPGMKAILYPDAFCGKCRYCLAGDQPLCERVKIMGEHRDGGFADYVAMPSHCFFPLPDDADVVAAGAADDGAPYGLAHAVRQENAGAGRKRIDGRNRWRSCGRLPSTGEDGRGAHLCTSSSDAKIARAVSMGAQAGVNYRKDRVSKAILEMSGGGVDIVIDSVGEASWSESLKSLRRGGRLVTCGATTGGNPPAEIQRVFIRQLEIYGSTGGSVGEFRQLLDVFNRGLVKPCIDSSFRMADIRAGFDRLDQPRISARCLWSIDPLRAAVRQTSIRRLTLFVISSARVPSTSDRATRSCAPCQPMLRAAAPCGIRSFVESCSRQSACGNALSAPPASRWRRPAAR